MNHTSLHKTQHVPVYPGEYTPMLHKEELNEELKLTREGTVVQPLVNVRDYYDCYTVEVCIPGLNRQDFLLTVEDQTIYITVLHKEHSHHGSMKYQLHEFNYECFKREIMLPENADTELIKSHYSNGMLHMHIPKSTKPVENISMEVVVY